MTFALIFIALLVGHVADPRDRTRVSIIPQPADLEIHYRFQQSRSELIPESEVSSAAVIQGPANLVWRGNAITWHPSAKALSLTLGADTARVDGTYPLLTKFSSGWLLFLPAVTEAPVLDAVTYRLPSGWEAVEGPSDPSRLGFVYLGPPLNLAANAVITDGNVTDGAGDFVASQFDAALGWYEHELGLQRTFQPLVFLSRFPTLGTGTFVGDVTPNGIVNIQLGPDSSNDVLSGGEFRRFVAHEAFHVMGVQTQEHRSDLSPWLTEGAAEYAALLFEAREPEAGNVGQLVRYLNDCLSGLSIDREEIKSLEEAPQRLRYSCGASVQWLADLSMREGRESSSTFFPMWKGIFRQQTYSDEDFRNMVRARGGGGLPSLVNVILDGGHLKVTDISAALNEAGIVTRVAAPRSGQWTLAGLAAVYPTLCASAGGVGAGHGVWSLFTSEDCAGFGITPDIVSVNGLDINADGEQLFQLIRSHCEQGRRVTIGLQGGGRAGTVSAECRSSPIAPWPMLALEDSDF